MKFMSQTPEDLLKPQTTITDLLMKNLGGWKKERSHKNVHASDITKPSFCPRMYALLDITEKEKKDSYIDTALQATFDVGNATADLFTNSWAAQAITGNWECIKCLELRYFTTKPSCTCKTGGDCVWRYKEVRFSSKEYGVSGSIDALMHLYAPKLFATELKIMKVEDFNDLVAPLSEHRIRTAMYLRLIDESDSIYKKRINLTEARVFYISRGYGKKQTSSGKIVPFKEYVVKRNDASTEPYLQKAKQVKLFREQGVMPPGVCKTTLDGPAKLCSVCPECFSGKYPVTS